MRPSLDGGSISDREAAVAAERHPADLRADRALAALPLGAVRQRDDLLDHLRVVAGVEQLLPAPPVGDVPLQDLVEDFVRLELGFGDKEFALSNEIGPLYDPEETENLSKKLSELGIKEDSVLTVIDEDDEDPFVNVIISIEQAYVSSSVTPPDSHIGSIHADLSQNGSCTG